MTDDRTTRDDVVEQLRSHADSLDERSMTPGDAADETRRLARTIEREGPEMRTDGSGVAGRVREFGTAGINLTERAMGNLMYVLTALLWMGAGMAGFLDLVGFVCLLGGVVTLAVGNRLKGWSE